MDILALGEKIKRRRKELNKTLKDLAGDRITPGQISLVESGRSNPSMDLLEYLAGQLQTSVEYLMETEETQAEKICIYYEQIAEAYILNEEYIQGEKYIENALYYAEKFKLECRKARNLYLRANIAMNKDELVLAQQYLLSANVIYIKNNSYEEIIKSFLHLGKITLKLKAVHSAISYLKQAEKVYLERAIVEDFLLGEIYYNMAEAYFKIDNINKAMNYSFLAKQKFEQVNNREEYAKALLLLAEEYNKKEDLTNSIIYSKKALQVYNELQEHKNISQIENNLGKLFYEFENIEESFVHYEIAKEIRLRNKDNKLIETLFNMCENYIKVKEISKCEEVLSQAISYIGDGEIDNTIQYNLIWYRVYTIKENLLEAENILLDTFKLAKLNSNDKVAAQISIMLGKFYLDNKNDLEAAKYLNEGVNILKDLGIINSWHT